MAYAEVRGAKQLRASMKRAGIQMQEMKQLHADVAKLVAAAASPPVASGALAKSVRPAGQAAAAIVRAGGARIPYAGVQEWGWPRRHIRARHYLTDAASQTEPRWFELYVTEVQAIADQVRGI